MKIKKNVAISESGYVFNPSTGESFTVNPIGIELVNMIRDEKSYEEISKTILTRYTTDVDTFEKDYHDFIGFLKLYHLLENEDQKKN
jgi:hypothetical protein